MALYKQQLGDVIRQMREDLGLTQKQLAERAHVQESQTVSRWERGERAPQDLEAVAVALGTTAAEMLKRLEPTGATRAGITQLDRIETQLAELANAVMRIERRMLEVGLDVDDMTDVRFATPPGREDDRAGALREIDQEIARRDAESARGGQREGGGRRRTGRAR